MSNTVTLNLSRSLNQSDLIPASHCLVIEGPTLPPSKRKLLEDRKDVVVVYDPNTFTLGSGETINPKLGFHVSTDSLAEPFNLL